MLSDLSRMSVKFSFSDVFTSSQSTWLGSFIISLKTSAVESEFPGCNEISLPALSSTISSSNVWDAKVL